MGMIRAHQLGGQRIKVKKLKKPGLTKAQQQAKDDYEALKAKWAQAPKFAGKYPTTKTAKPARKSKVGARGQLVVESQAPELHAAKQARFVDMQGSTGKAAKPAYTGQNMLGIASMHKSNHVPVFSSEHLVDIANMRRNDYTRDVKVRPNNDNGILPPSDEY